MLARRTLRAMRDRWQRDLDRIEAAYPEMQDPDFCGARSDPLSETARNLATAIAHIGGMITAFRPGDPE